MYWAEESAWVNLWYKPGVYNSESAEIVVLRMRLLDVVVSYLNFIWYSEEKKKKNKYITQ